MAKLDYASGTEEIDAEIRRRRGGRLRPLDRMLLHSPPVALGWNACLGAVRQETAVDGALRELVILRVAVLNACDYEWTAHVLVARGEGLPESVIEAVRRRDPGASLSPLQSLVCRYTDEMTRDVEVSTETFSGMTSAFSEREIVEITVTAAAYNMVSRFLVALGVGEEPHTEGVADV